MHKLLRRQLNKHLGPIGAGGPIESIPPSWERLLEVVSEAYEQNDADRALLEHSLELSSHELLERNQQLRWDIAQRQEIEKALRQAQEQLEARVQERTSELLQTNEALQAEVKERMRAEEELRKSTARYEQMFKTNRSVQWLVDPETGVIVDANQAACDFYGYSLEELQLMCITDINVSLPQQEFTKLAQMIVRSPTYLTFKHKLASGELRDVEVYSGPLDVGERTLLYSIIHDITDRKAFEEQLQHQAFHDPLTGLPNRALFINRLDHALIRARRLSNMVAVLFIDLDNFKTINDSLGHKAGDQLLIRVSERLQASVRPEDTLARLGGDEFTILLEDLKDVSEAICIAQRIAEQLQPPFFLGITGSLQTTSLHELEVFVVASIGIALQSSPDDHHERASDLLRNADIAMYEAKSHGKARYAIFEQNMTSRARKQLQLETDLRRALEREEFRIHYQPIMELDTSRISGLEALVRWQHPQRGLIPPADFIPIAEQSGLIVPIGQWVLE